MNPGALSKAAAGLASVEGLTPGRAAVFLSICAQTGKDGTCFISQGKLGKRCGITRKHAHDSVAWLIEKGQSRRNLWTADRANTRFWGVT